MKVKLRLDQLLVDRGLAPSREKAKALVLAGEVLVNDRPVDKAGAATDPEATVRLRHQPAAFVGRGGDKLAGARLSPSNCCATFGGIVSTSTPASAAGTEMLTWSVHSYLKS